MAGDTPPGWVQGPSDPTRYPVHSAYPGFSSSYGYQSFGNGISWDLPAAKPAKRPELIMSVMVIVLVVVAAVLPFSGIGNTAGGGGAAMRAALASTFSQQSFKATASLTLSAEGTTLQFTGTAEVDEAAQAFSGNLQGTMNGQRLTVGVELVGGVEYLKMAQLTQFDGGKPWVSISAATAAKLAPSGSSGISSATTGTLLKALQQAGGTVRTLGTSTIDGVTVQGYGVDFTVASVLTALAKAGMPTSLGGQAATALAGSTADVTVNVDAAGLVRRLSADVTVQSDGQSSSLAATIDISDYGQPVHIEAPPATSVATLKQVLPSLGSSGLGALLA